MIILGTNSIKDTGFNVANSLRFDTASDDYLNRTVGTPTQSLKYTISAWVKRSVQSTNVNSAILGIGNSGSSNAALRFKTNDTLQFYDHVSNADQVNYITNRVFRDNSAWYHVVVSSDRSLGSPETKIFINGVQETSFGTSTEYNQNDGANWNTNGKVLYVGSYNTSEDHIDGYLAELVFIDGSILAPTEFGEFDEDSAIWKPKDVSGLTFGDNGYYLDFENSGALGADVSGNSNNFTVNNLTAIDQSTDTCTNNFATLNPLDNYFAGSTFSEGNLKVVTTGGNITYNTSTIGFSSGKWYMETKLAGSSGYTVGVVRGVATANDNNNKLGNRADGWSYDDGGDVEHNGGSLGGSFASYSSGNIIGIYADLDNNKLYFSKDGSLQNSGTGLTLTAGTYFFAVGDNNASNSSTYEVNFGSPSFAISSGNTDGEYGNFEYSTTITGDGASKTFKALNTKNLAEFG